jgi:alanine-glyoxylate transaminase/serine-glyoxylate transaminase/serine-pyruvate transaminase
MEIRVDDWGIDVCVTAANKCLEAVPGISFISIAPRAWEWLDQQPEKSHGWYLNLKTWRKYVNEWGSWHPSPVTTPSSAVLAVLTSMRRIVQGGLDAHFAKYRRASQAVRKGLVNLGFDMFVPEDYASTVVTAVKARPEFETAELIQWLAEKRRIAIGGAFGALAGKIFRVGHLGKAAGRDYLIDFLSSMEEFLRSKGSNVPTGASMLGLEEVNATEADKVKS